MAEIPIFPCHARVSTFTALRSASTPNSDVKEELKFQPLHHDGGEIQVAPATTIFHRPMAKIPIFLRHAPVSTSTALRSASAPNRDTISTPLRHRLRQ